MLCRLPTQQPSRRRLFARVDYQCARQAGRVGDETLPTLSGADDAVFSSSLPHTAGLVSSAYAGGLNLERIKGARRNKSGWLRAAKSWFHPGEVNLVYFLDLMMEFMTSFSSSDAKTWNLAFSQSNEKGLYMETRCCFDVG